MVKRLVDLHGGSVTAASAGAGRGSAFTVRLPAVPAPAAAAPAGAEPAAPTGPGRRILVVEDNADAREMLQALLEASGHVVAAAEDGPSGLAALRAFRPEIALIDVGLPGIDGYDVARAARGDPETRQVRLVAGFDRHMTKPVDPAPLRALLASL